ncbi:MAG: hypothetical protein ABI972_03280 [Acidobacteriota bacterium]
MTTRQKVCFGAALFVAPVAIHLLYERVANVFAANAIPFPVPPITLEFREVLDNVSSRRISSRRIVAYRADGAFSETKKSYRKNGEEMQQRRTLRFPAGIKITVEDTIKTTTTWRVPDIDAAHWRTASHYNPADDCVTDLNGATSSRFFARNEERSGFQAVLIQNRLAPGIDTWHAPSLGCLEVGRIARFRDSAGKESDSSELILEQHRMGEPDAALFEVPSDYEEVDPVEATRRLYTTWAAPPIYLDRAMADPTLKRMAEAYAKYHAR